MDANIRKVIELVAAALPAREQNRKDDFYSTVLTDDDFKRQGMSIDLGVSILKHEFLKYPVVDVSDIYLAGEEDGHEAWNATYANHYCVHFLAHPMIADWLVDSDDDETEKPKLSFENATLTINDKKISFGSPDAKEYGAYVLEHLFSHDLHDASFFHDIHSEILHEASERYSGKRYYDACNVIQKRVAKEAGIVEFLLIKSGERGFVRINPKLIP